MLAVNTRVSISAASSRTLRLGSPSMAIGHRQNVTSKMSPLKCQCRFLRACSHPLTSPSWHLQRERRPIWRNVAEAINMTRGRSGGRDLMGRNTASVDAEFAFRIG